MMKELKSSNDGDFYSIPMQCYHCYLLIFAFFVIDISLHWLYDFIISSQLFHQMYLTINK